MEGRALRTALARFSLSLGLLAGSAAAPADDAGHVFVHGVLVDARGAGHGIDFVADVRDALSHLACDTLLDDVLAAGARIEIRYTAGPTRVLFRPHERHAVIDFNPRLGIRVDQNRIQSPALVLGHELGHVYRALHGGHETKNRRFTPAEEAAVIEEIEARIARLAGEPVRRGYVGTPVAVSSVTLGRSSRPPRRLHDAGGREGS